MKRGVFLLVAFLTLVWGGYAVYQRTGPAPELPADLEALDALLREAIENEVDFVAGHRRSLDAWRNLGRMYEANALFADAARCYERILGTWPGDARTHYHLACVQERSGDLALATSTMEKAVELAPEYGGAWSRLAAWALDLGEIELAQEALEQGKRSLPGDRTLAFIEVRLELARRAPERALALIEQNGLLQGHDEYGYHLLSLALRQSGDLRGAEEAHAKGEGSRLSFEDPWTAEMMRLQTGYAAMRRTAGRHLRARRLRQAQELLEQVVANDPADVRSLNMLGVCYTERKDYARALDTFEKLFELEPEHHDAQVNYAKAVLAGGVVQEAVLAKAEERLRAALARRPGEAAAWRQLATFEENRGKPEEALTALERVLQLEPTAHDVQLKSAYLQLSLQRFDAALERFLELQSDAPDLAEAWLGEVSVLTFAGRKEEAQKALEALETLDGKLDLDAERITQLRSALEKLP